MRVLGGERVLGPAIIHPCGCVESRGDRGSSGYPGHKYSGGEFHSSDVERIVEYHRKQRAGDVKIGVPSISMVQIGAMMKR